MAEVTLYGNRLLLRSKWWLPDPDHPEDRDAFRVDFYWAEVMEDGTVNVIGRIPHGQLAAELERDERWRAEHAEKETATGTTPAPNATKRGSTGGPARSAGLLF